MEVQGQWSESQIEDAIKEGKKVLYRYHDIWKEDSNDKRVALFAYIALRETSKGVWIEHPDRYNQEKWVDTTPGGKRFAYLSKENAMDSFIKRKSRQVQILKNQLAGVRSAMASIGKLEPEIITYLKEKEDERRKESPRLRAMPVY